MSRVLVFLILLSGCGPAVDNSSLIEEYGELYFTMVCWWSSQQTLSPAIFWCTETVDTELLKGYVSLAVEEDLDGERFLSICGKDVTLNSGHELHDNLIASMTAYTYNCFETYERSLGNEFDWIWNDQDRILQLIWRPDEDVDKVLSLFIEEKVDSPRVEGSIYYKTGYFD